MKNSSSKNAINVMRLIWILMLTKRILESMAIKWTIINVLFDCTIFSGFFFKIAIVHVSNDQACLSQSTVSLLIFFSSA